MHHVYRILVATLCFSPVSGFGGLGGVPFDDISHSVTIASSNAAAGLLAKYTATLAAHPLETKMATGAVLAVAGDSIAQSREPEAFDKRRASSFMVFDMAYRAVQHQLFPVIVKHCHGQLLLGALASVPALAHLVTPDFAAAMERTLASQLGIVPFMYYPVFFALTGAVQGLSVEKAVDRAKQNFLPLMERNLLFWIPVQFIQFGFIEENLQIPFLSVCGLCWTFILSVMAGSTKHYNEEEELPYCVTGMEGECIINPDELFPDTSLEEISQELSREVEELSHGIEEISSELSHGIEEITHGIEEISSDITHGFEEITHDVLAVFDHEEMEQTKEEEMVEEEEESFVLKK